MLEMVCDPGNRGKMAVSQPHLSVACKFFLTFYTPNLAAWRLANCRALRSPAEARGESSSEQRDCTASAGNMPVAARGPARAICPGPWQNTVQQA